MNKLTENHFSFKCPMNWDEMAPTDRGRFCDKCRKEVFDLTKCSIDEVIALQKKHGPICGSIRVAQVVAAAAISLSAAACHTGSGTAPITGKPVRLVFRDQTIDRNTIDGVILPPEQLEKMKRRE